MYGGLLNLWRSDGLSVQFVRARIDDDLLQAVARQIPMTTAHEGIWILERHDDHFTITSKEAVTVGPFRWLEELQDRLDVFGLELRQRGGQRNGYAHFAELESGCIADAIDRLYWLEDSCWRINRGVAQYTAELWQRALEGVECAPELSEGDVVNPLAFLPDLPPRQLRSDYA